MSEAVEEYAREYAREYASQQQARDVKKLMKNMNFTMEQVLNALEIQGEERELIIKRLQNHPF